jgi:hypothetical protein
VGKNPKKVVYGHVVIFLIALQQFFLQLLYGTKSGHQEKAPRSLIFAATLINALLFPPLKASEIFHKVKGNEYHLFRLSYTCHSLIIYFSIAFGKRHFPLPTPIIFPAQSLVGSSSFCLFLAKYMPPNSTLAFHSLC